MDEITPLTNLLGSGANTANATTAEAAYGALGLAELAPRERPYVVANMIATADGRASIDGRSAPMSSDTDRALFHMLRTQVDGVMAGAGTLRSESYGPMITTVEQSAKREALGLRAQPLAVTVTKTFDIPEQLPLLGDPNSTLVVFTTSTKEPPKSAATIVVERLDLTDSGMDVVMQRLRAHHGVRSLLCEGGPLLLGSLIGAGLLDELFLSISPLLVGGGEADQIMVGEILGAPVGLVLVSVLEHHGSLFLLYRIDH